jgi:hypothetical protein
MSKFSDDFNSLLLKQPISVFNRELIKAAYVNTTQTSIDNAMRYKIAYVVIINAITIMGATLSALISIEQAGWFSETSTRVIFWFTWVLSLLILIINKLLYAFDIPKNHILGEASAEKYQIEGWMFMGGSGKYAECKDMDARVSLFLERVEKIKIKTLANKSAGAEDIASAGTQAPSVSPGAVSTVSTMPLLPADNIDDVVIVP